MIMKMNIKEFREDGYLQEVNRNFLHPLGLALSVSVDDDGNESIDGIVDNRNDPDGMFYDLANSDESRKEKFRSKASNVDEQRNKLKDSRFKLLGFDIEPLD